jgi:hypothetical protein
MGNLRTVVLICLAVTWSRADILSHLAQFDFVSPGVTGTKNGIGFELSAGQNEVGKSEALLGGVIQFEPRDRLVNIGVETGLAVFQAEFGGSFSRNGFSPFFTPNLCLPIPAQDRKQALVLNLFYRIYPALSKQNSLGGSLKIAFLWE